MSKLADFILGREARALELQRALCACPAIGPENGGQGEWKKAAIIKSCLSRVPAMEIIQLDAPDARVESGLRPNIIAKIPGQSQTTLWLFAHMDVVPPGDLSLWRTNPWELTQKGDLVFGRGVEDNQQALCSMLILAEALARLRIQPQLSLGLVFMADEECGSAYGLDWLLRQNTGFFQGRDLFIVPDGGAKDSAMIEIAEKTQLWLKFSTFGRQCHASMPGEGVNALVAASALILRLQTLNDIFPQSDPLFIPPTSTFTPTKRERNVDAVNILPGNDVFYLDCRLLPSLNIDEAIARIKSMAAEIEESYGARINIDIIQRHPASAIPEDSLTVKALENAIRDIYKVQARVCGIGGATVASCLREKGFEAAVWSTIFNTCHQPNEYSSLAATCGDAAVFAHILMNANADRTQI